MSKSTLLTYSEIGQEYRKNFTATIIKSCIKQIIVSLLLCAANTLFFIFAFGVVGISNDILQILFGEILLFTAILPFLLFLVFTILRVIRRKEELANSDEWLGRKYVLFDKRVKGFAKRRVKPLLIALPIIAVLVLGFNVFSVHQSFVTQPALEENLIQIEGEVAYFNVTQRKKSELYTIGLKDDTTLYDISYDTYYPCDKTIKDEIKVGDYVYLSIDSTQEPSKAYEEGYDSCLVIYTFRTSTKEYLTYKQYIDSFNEKKKSITALYIVNYSIGGAATLGFVAAIIYSRIQSSKEEVLP